MASATLNKRPLGSSGIEISTVGFGAWAAGGASWIFSWGAQDDAESVAAIRRAVDQGVNWIDTAAVYGIGHSEEVVGRALREIPAAQRPMIFTKCGVLTNAADPYGPVTRTIRPDSIRHEIELSLKRLGIERIDLYQFHWPDATGVPVEDSWGEMVRLIAEGKVRAAGVSNFDVALLERCERIRHVDSLQPPFSMIRRQAAADVIPWCAAHGTGVIVYSPMQSGLLTDSFSADRMAKLGDDDWRRKAPEFLEPKLGRNLRLRDALRPIAERHGVSVSAVSAAWTLTWRGVTGAIVGARSAQQVDGWIAAGQLELSPQDLDEIARAIEQTEAGEGPARPAQAGARAGG
ncbi:MAG: aldo/keto reductase [Candidatus Acidiferrales bacterium]